MGFNCLRLPYSLEMHLKNARLGLLAPLHLILKWRSRPSVTAVAANPKLMNLTVWEILEKTIEALASAEIMVILNNHQVLHMPQVCIRRMLGASDVVLQRR